MRKSNNQTVTRIVLEEPTSIVIKQWPDINQPTMADPLFSVDWTPAICLLTTEFV
jgi:hypothetical protein